MSDFSFFSWCRTAVLAASLLGAVSAVHAAASYSTRDGLLSASAMNVPGAGAFEVVLSRDGGAGPLAVGTTLRLASARPLGANDPVSLPSGFQNSDQTLMVPALAVAAPDGSVGYFDVKLRVVASGAALGFVVSSMADTAIGRTVAGPARDPQVQPGPRAQSALLVSVLILPTSLP